MTNIGRIADLLVETGADWAVLTGADSICFALGHIVPIEIGQSPFSGGPSVAFIGRDGSAGLVCPNTDAAQRAGYEQILYAGFANVVTDQVANYRSAVQQMVRRLGFAGCVGFEATSFPYILHDLLPDMPIAIDKSLARLRAIKSAAECARMTVSAQVAAIGQMEARKLSQPGSDEMAVFGAVRSKMEQAAGQRIAFAGEYITGIGRSAKLGEAIAPRRIETGDPVICDLAPRVNGYWGDSCTAFIAGGAPSDAYRAMYSAARETLDLAISELRPGLRACDFDATLRTHMKGLGYAYPHHSGHGIGASVHEFPRLVPDETALFEENMFIMVEPGSYAPDIGGVRCEFMLRVTGTGCEIVAPFEMSCE
mgnify:CR=1 FL=1